MRIPQIVEREQLREWLDLPAGQGENRLQFTLDAATQLVCEYIADRQPEDEDWIAEIESWGFGSPEAPKIIVAAILTQAGEMYRFRGDDEETDSKTSSAGGEDLSPRVKRLLKRYRSPSIA